MSAAKEENKSNKEFNWGIEFFYLVEYAKRAFAIDIKNEEDYELFIENRNMVQRFSENLMEKKYTLEDLAHSAILNFLIFWRLNKFESLCPLKEEYDFFISKVGEDIINPKNDNILIALDYLVQVSLKYKTAAFALEDKFDFYGYLIEDEEEYSENSAARAMYAFSNCDITHENLFTNIYTFKSCSEFLEATIEPFSRERKNLAGDEYTFETHQFRTTKLHDKFEGHMVLLFDKNDLLNNPFDFLKKIELSVLSCYSEAMLECESNKKRKGKKIKKDNFEKRVNKRLDTLVSVVRIHRENEGLKRDIGLAIYDESIKSEKSIDVIIKDLFNGSPKDFYILRSEGSKEEDYDYNANFKRYYNNAKKCIRNMKLYSITEKDD